MISKSFRSALVFILFSTSITYAEETTGLIQQSRMWAMGGAGIALADDEYALFQNPAGLGGSDRRGIKISSAMEASWDVYTAFSDATRAFRRFSIDSLNVLMGKNIYLRSSIAPIVTIRHFSIAYIADGQFSIAQYNRVNPFFKMGAMITHGVQFGYGMSFKQGKKSKDEFRVGAAGKILWRKGGYYTLSTADLLQATKENGNEYLNRMMGPFAIGLGFDLGGQFVRQLDKRSELSFGTSLTDIGNTKFASGQAQPIRMDWGLGAGYKVEFPGFSLALALDYKNIFTNESFSNGLHLGAELGLPLLTFYAGLNQLYVTYGLSFDLWVTKVTLMSYGEEMGVNFRQIPSRRYLFQFDFKLPI